MGLKLHSPWHTSSRVIPDRGLVASCVAPPPKRDVLLVGAETAFEDFPVQVWGRLLSAVYPLTRDTRRYPLASGRWNLTRPRFSLVSMACVLRWEIRSLSRCPCSSCRMRNYWSFKTTPTKLSPSSDTPPRLAMTSSSFLHSPSHLSSPCSQFCCSHSPHRDPAPWMDPALFTPFTLDSSLSATVLTRSSSRGAPSILLSVVTLSTTSTRSSSSWLSLSPHPPTPPRARAVNFQPQPLPQCFLTPTTPPTPGCSYRLASLWRCQRRCVFCHHCS